MPLTAAATQGWEHDRYTQHEEVVWLPGDPGVTYTRGDAVTMGRTVAGSGGVLVRSTGGSVANPLGAVQKTVICPANTQAFPALDKIALDDDSAASKCLVKVRLWVNAGVRIFKVTFAGQVDDTVISYSAASLYIAGTTGHGADDRPNSAMIYVYEGPGAGEVNFVDDYDHTGGAVELLLQVHRPFATALTSASKYIVTSGEAAANAGISLFGRIDDKDENELETIDGADDGDYVVYGDYRTIGTYLKNLTLPVIKRQDIYAS